MTSALKIVAGLVVVLMLSLTVFLVPPHLQVRRVEPDLPSEAELRTLLTTQDGPVSVRFINTSSQKLPWGTMTHSVFLIEWANGNLFMIDAGMDREHAVQFGKLMEVVLDADEAAPHGTIAELLGTDIARVKGVAFTHLHIDHTQGVIPFCAARGTGASVYQTSWQSELHNFNTTEGAEILAESCLRPETLGSQGLMTIEGFPGLGVVALGGHTPGSTAFAIAGPNRLWILSGDTTNTKADLLSNTGNGFLYSVVLVPQNTDRTEKLRLWLAGLGARDDITLVVSHDLGDIEASGITEYAR